MSKSKIRKILALTPSTRGCGFAVLDDKRLSAFGLRTFGAPRDKKNERTVKFVSELIDEQTPTIIVFEDCSAEGCRRDPRIRSLLEQIGQVVSNKKVKIQKLSRKKVQQFVCGEKEATKYKVAQVLAKQFPKELVDLLPPKRKPWDSEHRSMDIFDAIAFALACAHNR